MTFNVKSAFLLVIGIALLPAYARANETTPFSDSLTGDWGGWRSRLRDDGFNFTLGYTTETASNVQGGTKEGVRYTDQWSLGSTLDLDKLLGLHDSHLQITVTDRNGRNLSSDEHLGS